MDEQISIRLPRELVDRLDRIATEVGLKRSGLIRRALYAYVDARFLDPDEKPIDRVRDLIGAAYGGPADLASRHREYLKEQIVERHD